MTTSEKTTLKYVEVAGAKYVSVDGLQRYLLRQANYLRQVGGRDDNIQAKVLEEIEAIMDKWSKV